MTKISADKLVVCLLESDTQQVIRLIQANLKIQSLCRITLQRAQVHFFFFRWNNFSVAAVSGINTENSLDFNECAEIIFDLDQVFQKLKATAIVVVSSIQLN